MDASNLFGAVERADRCTLRRLLVQKKTDKVMPCRTAAHTAFHEHKHAVVSRKEDEAGVNSTDDTFTMAAVSSVRRQCDTREMVMASWQRRMEIALCIAAELGHVELVHDLLHIGDVDVNAVAGNEDARTPLMLAAAGNHTQTLRRLLEAGANAGAVCATGGDGWKGLKARDIAKSKGYEEAMNVLSAKRRTLFLNGNIWCGGDEQDLASWMYIEDGRIISRGRGEDTRNKAATYCRHVVDFQGRRVVPGLIDAHLHVEHVGQARSWLDLSKCSGVASMLQLLETHVSELDVGVTGVDATSSSPSSSWPWIVGYGWTQDALGRFPSATDLDSLTARVTRHPVVLWRTCLHMCVVNACAMELAGITSETADPVGGVIERTILPEKHNMSTRQPSGILRETACEVIVRLVEAAKTDDERLHHIRVGLRECMMRGITAVQTNDANAWHLYRKLVDVDALPIRVFLTIAHAEMMLPGRPHANERYGAKLSCHRVKLFADGSLGGATAALSVPYGHSHVYTTLHHRCDVDKEERTFDQPKSNIDDAKPVVESKQDCGVLVHSVHVLTEHVRSAHERGFRIELHAIGDRAADVGLQAFRGAGLTAAARPMLTHCQVLRADLIDEMKELGVIANVQPQFLVTDRAYIDKRLPKSLHKLSYAWKSLLRAGVHVAGGSDAPVEVPDPLLGICASMFRARLQCDRNGEEKEEAWHPQEALSRDEAFALYTTGAAYAAGEEDCLGQLDVGFHADFVVMSRDGWANPSKHVQCKMPIRRSKPVCSSREANGGDMVCDSGGTHVAKDGGASALAYDETSGGGTTDAIAEVWVGGQNVYMHQSP